nr:MerR family transcriptional regulator [Pseudonocardia ammonioxydans]
MQETAGSGSGSGLASRVLHHWEAEGLLFPSRTGSGHRLYSRTDLFRVTAMVTAKRAAPSFDGSRALLDGDTDGRQARLPHHRDVLARWVVEQRSALDMHDQVVACRHSDPADCSRFRALLAEQVGDGLLGGACCPGGALRPLQHGSNHDQRPET